VITLKKVGISTWQALRPLFSTPAPTNLSIEDEQFFFPTAFDFLDNPISAVMNAIDYFPSGI